MNGNSMDWILFVLLKSHENSNRFDFQDWEFPGARDRDASPDSKMKFNILVKELRQAFDEQIDQSNRTNKLLLTAAVAADPKKIDQGYVVQDFCE